jgi:hypothetical protein
MMVVSPTCGRPCNCSPVARKKLRARTGRAVTAMVRGLRILGGTPRATGNVAGRSAYAKHYQHLTRSQTQLEGGAGAGSPNFTVRKQIWMVEHPEMFYATIDFAWQKEQLERKGFVR